MPQENLNPNPEQQGGAAPAQVINGIPAPQPQGQLSKFDELKQKKGFKDNDSIAKSYEEVEVSFGKVNSKLDNIKKNLETQGYTVDDNGNIVQLNQNQQGQQNFNQPGAEQNFDTVYDPYTNQPISPQLLAIARLPFGQREMAFAQFALDQREQMAVKADEVAEEVLSKIEDKTLVSEVKKIVSKIPMQYRVNKQVWEDAILKAKGTRYDREKELWQKQGEEGLINKLNLGSIPSAAVDSSSGQLRATPEEISTFKQYQQNQPGMFKDLNEFIQYSRNNTRPVG